MSDDDPRTPLDRAIELYANGRYDETMPELGRYLAQHGDDPEALFYRGVCHRHLGDPAASVRDLDQVIEACPEEWNAYLHRGHAYRALDREAEALADFERFIEHKPDDVSDELRDVVEQLTPLPVRVRTEGKPTFPAECSCCGEPGRYLSTVEHRITTGYSYNAKHFRVYSVEVPLCTTCRGHAQWDLPSWFGVIRASMSSLLTALFIVSPITGMIIAGLGVEVAWWMIAVPALVPLIAAVATFQDRSARRRELLGFGPEHTRGSPVSLQVHEAAPTHKHELRFQRAWYARRFLQENPGARRVADDG